MKGAYTLELMMFSLGTIHHAEQEKDDAWCHLGFIPKHSHPKDTAMKNLKCYHECLGILLTDLNELQDNPPLVTLHLFGTVVNVRLVFEVAFLIGDKESQGITGQTLC